MNKSLILLSLALMCGVISYAQDYNFGIRAGLNFSTYRGPSLQSEAATETIGYSNGFHFGITWDYNITDLIAIKTELLYIQNGAETSYEGDTYYKIYLPDDQVRIEEGTGTYNLNVSNAYLSIPVMLSGKVSPKIELYGGVYANILVQPTGRGTLDFESTLNSAGIRFIQSLDYNYRTDEAGESNDQIQPLLILVDGERTATPKVVGAYYQFDESEKTTKTINSIDAGLTLGANYFLNKGFYIGVRAQYGLLDITDNQADRILTNLDENGNIIFSDDDDYHFGIQASFGFKF